MAKDEDITEEGLEMGDIGYMYVHVCCLKQNGLCICVGYY